MEYKLESEMTKAEIEAENKKWQEAWEKSANYYKQGGGDWSELIKAEEAKSKERDSIYCNMYAVYQMNRK